MSWERDHGITHIATSGRRAFTAVVSCSDPNEFCIDGGGDRVVLVCWVQADDVKGVVKQLREYFERKTPIGDHEILVVLDGFVSRADWDLKRRRPM